ncbi:MAG TPA: methyltransferase domain-containing protein [Candidatus Acidoferrales bacterium]|nr:methyltransferase domain-containing protein [Candidatus Acidoferrales bacterium]
MKNLKEIYASRFSEADAAEKNAIWMEVAGYLQRFIPRDAAVVDVGCDRGDFIRNIEAAERWATDVRDTSAHLPPEVKFCRQDSLKLREVLPLGHFDVVFMSNFLEHLPSSQAIIEQLQVARDLLQPGGIVIVLQPNIRLVGGRYWDFIDHTVALTEKSLEEAGVLAGLRTRRLIVRFLPYSTKSRLPRHHLLVRWYLRLRPLWLLLGKQTLYIAARPLEGRRGQ